MVGTACCEYEDTFAQGGRRGEKGRMGWVVVEGPQGDGHRGLTVGEGS